MPIDPRELAARWAIVGQQRDRALTVWLAQHDPADCLVLMGLAAQAAGAHFGLSEGEMYARAAQLALGEEEAARRGLN